MPRPITKKDAKFIRANCSYQISTCKELGYYVYDKNDPRYSYAYQMSTGEGTGMLWVTAKTFQKRKKLGHPKPRKKRYKVLMREPDFSLEEMALAEAIMNGG